MARQDVEPWDAPLMRKEPCFVSQGSAPGGLGDHELVTSLLSALGVHLVKNEQ